MRHEGAQTTGNVLGGLETCKILLSEAAGSSSLHLTQTSFTDEPVEPLLPELVISRVR